MTVLKYKQIENMKEQELKEKLKELKKEMIKARISGGKTTGNVKIKEIKKAIARIFTFKNKLKNDKEKKI